DAGGGQGVVAGAVGGRAKKRGRQLSVAPAAVGATHADQQSATAGPAHRRGAPADAAGRQEATAQAASQYGTTAPTGDRQGATADAAGGQGAVAGAGGERVEEQGRTLSVAPGGAGVARSVAAPGQPDGVRAPLKSTAGTVAKVARRDGVVGQEPKAAPELPEVRAWGARLAQAVSEVLAGDRPISQLVRFTDDVVFLELNRRVRLLGLNSTAGLRGAKEKSVVRSVRVFMPEPFIAEVAAHVRHGSRSRAVAFRLEIRRNRWVCTALELD
ncbi:Rv3235 family protein, partial [Kribbella sp. NPDC003557]|uniref:Rv3235 family protein n=1 Tax=Kribbella sp. NPDC003557 TaxID=3154449 RepID=UPI0033AA90A4